MTVIVWIILRILVIALGAYIVYAIIKHKSAKDAFLTIKGGIKSALRDCGFVFKPKTSSLELYVWVPQEDETCEDAMERASWPPMDIADWMKAGLPRTPEAGTACGKNCRCELMLIESELQNKNT